MITSARIEAVNELGGIGWITCLRAPPSASSPLMTGRCRCPCSTSRPSPSSATRDYPGERLIAGRNPPPGIGVRERTSGRIFTAWIPALARNRKSAARSPRFIAVQEEEEAKEPFRAPMSSGDMADVESIHAFEGTETIQTLIVGADITGTGACS
jgi:hypothetical protein